jgi:nucleoside-diphosphate-sugar epimerase
VTGATGFIAGHLIPRLLGAGHRVYAAGHDPARLARLQGAEPVLVDLRAQEIAPALPPRASAVIHLAQANVPVPERASELFEVNTGSTARLLDYARRAGVERFVLASSGSVYGGGDRPWREDDYPRGDDLYAATKLASERLVQAYQGEFGTTILRLFAPYGPGQQRRLVPRLIQRVRDGQPVTLQEGRGPRFNPIFVTHVVDVIEQALAAEGHHLVNLGGDDILSVRAMAETIGRMLGRTPQFQDVPGRLAGDFVGDIGRLRRTFRLPDRLTSFEQGVQATIRGD